MRRFVVGAADVAGQAERLDKVLARLMPETSRSTLQRWIAERRVRVDGAVVAARAAVRAGAVLDVEPGSAPRSAATPDPSIALAVLHEDSHLIVLDKPPGLVVHPARGHRDGTLVNALLGRPGFAVAPADPRDPDGFLRPGIVHRLDKDTSGVLVVAKDEPTREGLKAQLGARTMERRYEALTVGCPRSCEVRTLHGRHPKSRLRFSSFVDRGREAVTHVELLASLAGGAAAHVACRLETGRTHQIRVHLAERTKTPILADRLYGGLPSEGALREIAEELGRQALHAALLGFVHPITGERLRFETALPADMHRALTRLAALGRQGPGDDAGTRHSPPARGR